MVFGKYWMKNMKVSSKESEGIRVNQRIQLMVTLFSLFIHDDLLIKDAVSSVEIHNPTLI